MQPMTRRNAIGAAGKAALAAGLTAAVPAFAQPGIDHSAAGIPDTWDYEADVVVVGYGGAGAVTALTAADDGADVIILEKYPADDDSTVNHTPSARFSGGFCVCVDDAEQGSQILEALSAGTTPKDVCDAWGQGALNVIDWWRGIGADFPDPAFDVGEYPDLPGGHCIGIARETGSGMHMFQVLKQNVENRLADKVRVLWETAGTRLIQNRETQEVVGCVGLTADGQEVNVKARKAVVICTGGFEWDEDMKRNFLRGYPSWFYANPNNNGDGIRMGQAVGGALWHMNAISARAIPYHPDWPKGTQISLNEPYIFVNKYGRRWFYETPWPPHNAWVEFVHFSSDTAEYQADPAWIVYDATSAKPLLKPHEKGYLTDPETDMQYWGPEGLDDEETAVERGWLLRADTPEELAALIAADEENSGRMTGEALAQTIERYNGFCEQGVDEDFGRKAADLVALATPPYYAVKVYPGGPNTQGGLKKDATGHVLDAFDQPISRLYCCGENGSVYGFLYPASGGNICEFAVFGQICGHNAAAEQAWE